MQHFERPASRRDFLCRAGGGFGALALLVLLGASGMLEPPPCIAAGAAVESAALSPKAGQLLGRAKSVIFLFMDGGPSHLDTFDHKPMVTRFAGKPLPPTVKRVFTPMSVTENPILAPRRTWTRYGESGLAVSDWYRHVGPHVDDICMIHSCVSDGLNHVGSVSMMNTGSLLGGRPSLGAWVNYGLGSENHNLPGFVVLLDNDKEPPGGSRVWGTGFMPATYQGTRFRSGREPILDLHPPERLTEERHGEMRQRGKLEFLRQLNRRHLQDRAGDN